MHNNRQQNIRSIFFISLVGFVLFSSLYIPLFKIKDLAPFENRSLAKQPKISSAKDLLSFPSLEDVYLADHIVLRNRIIDAYYFFRRTVLKENIFPDVVIGKDDWLFYTHYLGDTYQKASPLKKHDLASIQKNLLDFKLNLDSQGIKLYVIVAPYKETIYPEYLPADIPIIGKSSNLDQFLSYLRDHPGVDVIDLRNQLLEQKKKSPQVLYYKSDTHWNQLGCYFGYNSLISEVSKDFPSIKPHLLSDYSKTTVTLQGDLARFLSMPNNWIERSTGLKPNFKKQYQDVPTGDSRLLTTQANNPDLPIAVIFRDSFATCLIPMLSEHFSRATYIWDSANYDLIRKEKPDMVIVEIAEPFLRFWIRAPNGKPYVEPKDLSLYKEQLKVKSKLKNDQILYQDTFDDATIQNGWMTSGNISLSNGQMHIIGDHSWNTYAKRSETIINGQGIQTLIKLSNSSGETSLYLSSGGSYSELNYRLWGVTLGGGRIYRDIVTGSTLDRVNLGSLKANTWYVIRLKLDVNDQFQVEVEEQDNPSVHIELSEAHPDWKMRRWTFFNVVVNGAEDLASYQELNY